MRKYLTATIVIASGDLKKKHSKREEEFLIDRNKCLCQNVILLVTNPFIFHEAKFSFSWHNNYIFNKCLEQALK